MGLDSELVRLLLEAKRAGVSYRRCLTLGRQHFFPGNTETRALFCEFGIDANRFPKVFSEERPRYSEPFWEALGAERLESLDASGFEGATVVHDLNQPIPPSLVEAYDAVCDAGTLEHVFHFPVAMRTCMEMVAVGGHLLLFTTANNYFGHGFYQFSPELFYRVLSPVNGYRVERMVAVEYGPFRKHYEVADPEAIRRRVNLINSFPVLLFVQAKRVARSLIFERVPQQSDYVAMWTDALAQAAHGPGRSGAVLERAKHFLVERWPKVARFLEAYRFSSWNRGFSFRDRGAFRRVR